MVYLKKKLLKTNFYLINKKALKIEIEGFLYKIKTYKVLKTLQVCLNT